MKAYRVMIAVCVVLSSASLATAEIVTPLDFSAEAIRINFDVFPDGANVADGTSVTSQYAQWGVLFSGPSAPRANGQHQDHYGPLASPPNVLIAGDSQIWLNFIDPFSGLDAPTSAVGADIIFRNTGDVTTLEVFDEFGVSLGSVTTPPDTDVGDEVFIGFSDPLIYSATFFFDTGDPTVGIDNLIMEPVPEPATILILGLGCIGWLRRPAGL